MKIFKETPSSWHEKVNFVDKNNVVVGYDLSQSCCEHAGWYISEEKRIDSDDEKSVSEEVLPDYVFDKDFFEEAEKYDCPVRFRLMAEGKPDLFLHLFNIHNGYYSHGFTLTRSGTIVKEGSL